MIGFLKKLYAQVYITIVAENHYIHIHARVEKIGSLKEEGDLRCETTNGKLTEEAISFIERFERKSPFSYITLLNPLMEQGAVKGCEGKAMQSNIWLCAGGKKHSWSIYTDAMKLKALQNNYQKTGIDFIFSPFSVIRSYFKSEQQSDAKLYLLVLEKSLSVAIFKKGSLEYAQQISLDATEDSFDLGHDDLDDDLLQDIDDHEDEKDIDFDLDLDIDAEPIEDEHEPLDSLDELDNLDHIESLDEDHHDLEESAFIEEHEEEPEEETTELLLDEGSKGLGGFSRNYKRFELIHEMIHEFYHNSTIESSFIEQVYMIDPYNDAKDLQGYLEDELFVTVERSVTSIHGLLTGLTKNEISNAS